MIEAFEIGIKLALQDGVSSGVLAVRRDLDALDRAIASTTVGLARLQRLGIDALGFMDKGAQPATSSAISSRAAPVQPPDKTPSEGVADSISAAVGTGGDTPRTPIGSSAAPVIIPSLTGSDAGAAASSMAQVIVPVRAPTALEKPPVLERPAVTVPAPLPLTAAAPSPAGAVAAQRPVAVPVQIQTVLAAPPSAAPQVTSASPSRVYTNQTVLPSAGAAVATGDRVVRAVPPRPVARVVVQPQPDASVASLAPQRTVHHRSGATQNGGVHVVAAAAAMNSPVAGKPDPASDARNVSPPSYAPAAQGTRNQGEAIIGDVFLDGARMGRWMSDRMTQEAGRPSAGPTGFDSRRSATWPGAAVAS